MRGMQLNAQSKHSHYRVMLLLDEEREKKTEIQKERASQRGTETERDARREGETDRHSELMRENS